MIRENCWFVRSTGGVPLHKNVVISGAIARSIFLGKHRSSWRLFMNRAGKTSMETQCMRRHPIISSCVSVAAHAISNPSSRMKFIERYNVAMTLHLFAVIRALKHRVKHPLSPRRGTRLGVIHGDGYPNGVILSYNGCCFS